MIAIYIDKQLNRFEDEIKYTFDFIFKTLGYEYKYIRGLEQINNNDMLVFYGLIAPTQKEIYVLAYRKIMLYIPADPDLLQPGNISKDSLEQWKRTTKYIKNLPVISRKKLESPIYYHKNEELFYGNFTFDFLGNVFFHLTNSEESVYMNRDELGRMPDNLSCFLDEAYYPFVNKFLWLLNEIIKEAVSERKNYFTLRKDYWPQGEDFALTLSHTVRRVKKWTWKSILKSMFTDLLVFYKITYVFNNFWSRLKYIVTNIEEYWNFDFIDELEQGFGINSTYFFAAINDANNYIDYAADESDVREEIQRLYSKGNDIALLGSMASAKNDVLEQEKEALNEIISKERIGIRQAASVYDQKITTEYHNKHTFYYDNSRSYIHQPGYRNGLGFPFYNFTVLNIDIQNNEKKCLRSSCLEIPRAFSDETLILSRYKIAPQEEAKSILERMISIAAENQSVFHADFATHSFTEIYYNEELQRFLLEKISDYKVFKSNLLQLAEWWKKRDAVTIKEGKYGFTLYFPHKVDNFSLLFYGNYQIYEVEGSEYEIEDNRIFLHNVAADSEVKIRIKEFDSVESED